MQILTKFWKISKRKFAMFILPSGAIKPQKVDNYVEKFKSHAS